jgi:hypothetical protein
MVINDWNYLSEKTVYSTSAEVFKRRLEKEWEAEPSIYNWSCPSPVSHK